MRIGTFNLAGHSLGGIETHVIVAELKLAIDVGRGDRALVRCDHLALTHAHMDHIAGLPSILALRQLFRMPPPNVYVPAQSADALVAMLDAWRPLQRYSLDANVIPVHHGQRYPLRRGVWLEPFRTYHPVPSNGYTIIERVDKLKPEYAGLPGHEIGALKRAGHEVTRPIDRARLSVTGDTLVEVLDKQPQILASDALMLECTFLDNKKPLEHARAGGHVSLVELFDYAERFDNDTLVLSHFSQLHKPAEIGRLLAPLAARVRGELRAFYTEPGQDEIVVRS